MQVFLYDENKIYIKTDIVEKLGENMTTVSLLNNDKTGTIPHRPRFDEVNQVWVEDMTQDEIREWEDNQQIDICPEPTDKERITKLEEEKSILAENVYQLASIVEVMLTGGTEDDETGTVTTDTTN